MPFLDIAGYWFLDIVYTAECYSNLIIADTFGERSTGMLRFLDEGTYIFTVRIYSENADSKSIKLRAKWGGKWDELEASVIKDEGEKI